VALRVRTQQHSFRDVAGLRGVRLSVSVQHTMPSCDETGGHTIVGQSAQIDQLVSETLYMAAGLVMNSVMRLGRTTFRAESPASSPLMPSPRTAIHIQLATPTADLSQPRKKLKDFLKLESVAVRWSLM